MRSPADRLRLERALRLLGLAALAAWIFLALRPRAGYTERVDAPGLAEALERWTRSTPVAAAEVTLDTVPDDAHLAWLAALRGAGVPVHWSGTPEAVAVESYATADPASAVVVLTDASAQRILSDALGPIDTLRGRSVRLAAIEGDLDVRGERQHARLTAPTGGRSGGVYVAGSAEWEAKFVIAALEESGWKVSARLAVGPGQDVLQGSPGTLDTARYSAVVLLDSAAAERTRGLDRFVRGGGGVLLAGDANRATSIAPLTGWRSLKREVAPLGVSAEDTTWRGSSRVPFTPAANRAIVFERRGGNATLAARRHLAGRVLAVAYDQSWPWRMTGGANAVNAHREWWSRLVSSVALRAPGTSTGAAPRAALYSALGEPSRPLVSADLVRWDALARALGALALLSFVAEWLLRRGRGAA